MSKKKNKPFRPKARRPRGFEDRGSDVLRAEARLIQAAFSVYDFTVLNRCKRPPLNLQMR